MANGGEWEELGHIVGGRGALRGCEWEESVPGPGIKIIHTRLANKTKSG